mmetsp:Transcript_28799/g.37200  ORF Transcript_28799/g.37200 Transcript_28799/m.37200 type:complete len:561 (+) Transcript_28799:43-1725(+)
MSQRPQKRGSTTRLPAPDGGCEAWGMVAIAFTVMMHSSSMHYITGFFFVAWLDDFPHQSRAQLASVGSLSTAIMFGCAYLSGRLQYHWRSQGAVVLAGAILASAGLLLSSYVTDAWQLYITFSVIVGVGHALAFPPCPVVVSTWFKGKIGIALGITTAGASIGTIYLGFLFVVVDRVSGWRVAFRALALASFVAIGAAAFIFRVPGGSGTLKRVSDILSESIMDLSHHKRERSESHDVHKKRTNKGKLQILALLKHPRFSRVCLAYLLVAFAFDVPFVHLVRYALDENTSTDKADWLTAAVGIGGLCRVFVMSAADHIGKERVFTVVLFSLTISNLFLPIIIHDYIGALAYAFVIGVATGCLVALVLPLSTTALKPIDGESEEDAGRKAMEGLDIALSLRGSTSLRMTFSEALEDQEARDAAAADWPPSSSITSGLVYSSIAIGVFVGPVLVGWLYDHTGSYGVGFFCCGIFCFVACLVSFSLLPEGVTRLRCCGHEEESSMRFNDEITDENMSTKQTQQVGRNNIEENWRQNTTSSSSDSAEMSEDKQLNMATIFSTNL